MTSFEENLLSYLPPPFLSVMVRCGAGFPRVPGSKGCLYCSPGRWLFDFLFLSVPFTDVNPSRLIACATDAAISIEGARARLAEALVPCVAVAVPP